MVRGQINKRVGRIRRMVAWGVEEEWFPPTILHALKAIKGLKRGRTEAKEGKKVLPVPEAFVDAVRPHVSRQVWAMIELQRCSGMRPTEVCVMRTIDINMTGRIWEYRRSKTRWSITTGNESSSLGPKPSRFSRSGSSPTSRRSSSLPGKRWRNTGRISGRSARPPSSPRRRAARSRGRSARPAIVTPIEATPGRSARHASRPSVPHWAPNQLRHLVGTKVRKEMGLEAARPF